MKIKEVGSQTLVWYPEKVGVFGNCWSGMTLEKPSREVHVINIGLESLEATGVPFPIECELVDREGRALITDSRIPKDAFRTRSCGVHAGDEPYMAEWLKAREAR